MNFNGNKCTSSEGSLWILLEINALGVKVVNGF